MRELFDGDSVTARNSLDVTLSEITPDTILCAVAGEIDLVSSN